MERPSGGEPIVKLEFTTDGPLNGYKFCDLRAEYKDEKYMVVISRMLGAYSKTTVGSSMYVYKETNGVFFYSSTVPVADAPKWFKKVIRHYYGVAKLGVS